MKKNGAFSKGDEVFGKIKSVGKTHLTISVGPTTGRLPIAELEVEEAPEAGDQIMASVSGKSRGMLVLTRQT